MKSTNTRSMGVSSVTLGGFEAIKSGVLKNGFEVSRKLVNAKG